MKLTELKKTEKNIYSRRLLGRWQSAEQLLLQDFMSFMSRYWNTAILGREEGGMWDHRTQDGSEARTATHRENKKRDFNNKRSWQRQAVLSSWIWSHCVEGGLKPAESLGQLVTSEAMTEKCISGIEKWMQQTTMYGEIFRFKCLQGEDIWLVAFSERD